MTYADFINEGENWYPFPVDAELVSDLLRPAEVVIAVEINGNERTYPPGRIGDAAVNDVIGGESGIVFSRGDDQIATVFSPLIDPDGRQLDFEFANGRFTDAQIELEGTRLAPPPSRRAFWFTISISNPDVEVYGK